MNINNFADAFAYDALKDIIQPYMRVLIIPLSFHEDYIKDAHDFDEHFLPGKDQYEDIAKEFRQYGIDDDHIEVLHYFKDSKLEMRNKFVQAHILFLTGGYPDRYLYRIDELQIRPYIVDFKGIVMGTSAGAMIQFDQYHVTPEEEGQDYEYHNGLGLLSGFDIEVHYEDTFNHLAGLITDLKLHSKPIFALPNTGGMIVDGQNYQLLGDAFEITTQHIDGLQEELDEIVEREAY